MTNVSTSGDGDPREQLSRARDLAHSVRRAQRATWFPLLVFAALTFLSIPVNRLGSPDIVACRNTGILPNGSVARVCVVHDTATWVYWPIALVLAYVVIAIFYRGRTAAQGLSSRALPYAIAGVIITVVLTGVSIWASHHVFVGQYDFLGWHFQAGEYYRLMGPAMTIGLALLVLAYVERSVALLGTTVVYIFVVAAPFDSNLASRSPWGFAQRIAIDGAVLLITAIGFALAQRPLRPVATAAT